MIIFGKLMTISQLCMTPSSTSTDQLYNVWLVWNWDTQILSSLIKIARSKSDHLIKRPLCIGMRGQGSSAIKLIHLILVFDKLTWKSRWIRFDWLRLDDVCHLTLQMIAFHSNCDLCFLSRPLNDHLINSSRHDSLNQRWSFSVHPSSDPSPSPT